jgi:hypothetical protein
MFGSFSSEHLERYAQLAAEKAGVNFAEGDYYDFRRCVRPNGTSYGTSGQCRKGTEQAKEVVKKETKNNDVAEIKEGFKKFFKENPDARDESHTSTMFAWNGDEALQEKLDKYLAKEFKNNVSPEEKKIFVEYAKEYAKDKEGFLMNDDEVYGFYEYVQIVQSKMLNKLGPVGKKIDKASYKGTDEFPLGFRYTATEDDVRDDYNQGRFGPGSMQEEMPSPQDILKLME